MHANIACSGSLFSKLRTMERVRVKGKFLYEGNNKFYLRGVTYGTFAPGSNGNQFPELTDVENDFREMAATGINCVRTYTVPPLYVLDAALRYGLRVMAGLPWEQHITFLDNPSLAAEIISRLQQEVKEVHSHPALFCYAIGNEIPSGIVRWHGPRKIKNFLRKIYQAVKMEAPDILVTYVNYPSTEYLETDFTDFNCFNVYLESPEKLQSYIARLHNLSGEKPLVLAETGLDSRRNGEMQQAAVLKWQIESIFSGGCAGLFVFAWTDQWWRGGYEITDWDFGLVTRDRQEKPALEAVTRAWTRIPVSLPKNPPFLSVVVCSYNGSRTIDECLTGLLKLDYPYYEIIVVNDGSTDGLPERVKKFPVKLITTSNQGLSHARNTGLQHARGEIIAYIDDDAFPDPHWLHYLAHAFIHSAHSCIGGPNIAPDDDGLIAKAVANAPGGPVHVLLTDELAEHVPGCNMAFRRQDLIRIGGFDPVFTNAGDDVDICWRLQQAGYTIGYHPSALVWHRRRNSVKAYWKQQKGYGKAEALLEAKWPEKYNRFGHLSWAGRIYGNGFLLPVKRKSGRIFHGEWGSALFQSVYQPAPGFWQAIPLMPEWYLFSAFTCLLGILGIFWPPLFWAWLVTAFMITVVIMQAIVSARHTIQPALKKYASPKLTCLIICLHLVQPLARLYGRMKNGLTPWRKRGAGISPRYFFRLRPPVLTHWSETWHSPEDWLAILEKSFSRQKIKARRNGPFDNWDLQVSAGLFMQYRGTLAVEEHGAGKQYIRFKTKLHLSAAALLIPLLPGALFLAALLEEEWIVSVIMGVLLLFTGLLFLLEKSGAMNSIHIAFARLKRTRHPVSALPAEEEKNESDSVTLPDTVMEK